MRLTRDGRGYRDTCWRQNRAGLNVARPECEFVGMTMFQSGFGEQADRPVRHQPSGRVARRAGRSTPSAST